MDIQETNEAEQAWASLGNQASVLDSELAPTDNQSINDLGGEVDAVEISTAELLAPVIKVTGDIFAPNWELDETECEQLGIAYGALIDKYLPDNPASKYGLEISAVMVTLAVFGSRKGVPMRIEEKPKKEAPQLSEQIETQEPPQTIFNQSANSILTPKAVEVGVE